MIVGRCRVCGLIKEVDDPFPDVDDGWPRCCDRPMRVAHFDIDSRRKDDHARMARDLLATTPKRLDWRKRAREEQAGRKTRAGG